MMSHVWNEDKTKGNGSFFIKELSCISCLENQGVGDVDTSCKKYVGAARSRRNGFLSVLLAFLLVVSAAWPCPLALAAGDGNVVSTQGTEGPAEATAADNGREFEAIVDGDDANAGDAASPGISLPEEIRSTGGDDMVDGGAPDGDDEQGKDLDLPSDEENLAPAPFSHSPRSAGRAGGNVGGNLALSGANQWQIVDGQYAGNGSSAKTSYSADGNVRVQKNVVPTDTENEFLVYLSMDVRETYERFLDDSKFAVTSSNKYDKEPIGTVVQNPVGNFSNELLPSGEQGGYSNRYDAVVNVYAHQGDTTPLYSYHDVRYGRTSNCSNASGFLYVPGIGYILASHKANLHNPMTQGSGGTLTFSVYLDQLSSSFTLYRTALETITDTMGDNVVFDEIVSCTQGSASAPRVSGGTITWDVSDLPYPDPTTTVGPPLDGWHENVAELVYRVHLDVEAPGFHSCRGNMNSAVGDAETYETNTQATLAYHKTALDGGPSVDGSTQMVDFQKPHVRGMLYDLEVKKTDDSSAPLGGALFGLTDANGSPVLDADGSQITATSGADGYLKFHDLAWGSYGAVELQPPAGYVMMDSHSVGPQELCWTTNSANLAQDHAGPHSCDLASDVNNAIMAGDTPAVENRFVAGLGILKRDARMHDPLPGVFFELRADDGDGVFSASDPVAATYSGPDLTQPIVDHVVTGADGTAEFWGLSVGLYWLNEVQTVAGYQVMSEPIRMEVTSDHRVLFHASQTEGGMDPATHLCTITIDNEPVPALPVTGQMPSGWLMLAGATSLVIGVCLSLLLARKKAASRNTHSRPI